MNWKNKFLIIIGIGFVALPAWADLDNERDLGEIAEPKTGDDKKKGGLQRPDLGKKPVVEPVEGTPQNPTQPVVTEPKKPNKTKKANLPSSKHDDKQPIKWSAKGLKASKDGRQVDLLDDVVVTQGDIKLVADQAKVFFDEQDEVEKIIAKGNVKMTRKAAVARDRISAKGNEAVFYNAEQKVVLRGRATLWRGGDVVRGKQISYKVDTGWITVDNVEGVVQPGEVKSE